LYAPVIGNETFGHRHVNVDAQRVDPNSLWNTLRRMIAVRQTHPAFGWGTFEWANLVSGDTPAVAAYWRRYQEDRLLIVQNLSDEAQRVQVSLPEMERAGVQDLLSGGPAQIAPGGVLEIALAPYAYHWFEVRPALSGGG
jgi:maltose alpha-D-glucosyltransferase/alpha-amylase